MNAAYLLLGSNLGDRVSYISKAVALLEQQAGQVQLYSSLYQTAPWPAENKDQQDFLNQAILLYTSLNPEVLLRKILTIEESLGRKRDQKWEARTIDIDILFYNTEVINTPHLIVPHPFLQERRFALLPLNEIAPDFTHPVLKKTIQELLAEVADNLPVTIHKKL